ncbi:hypothetical protein BDF20DRAFT_814285 [Mycotypha africana]|uniref:uncharacterized protein n=1 Tax=Mycotypha africana TaxID=64632 RepID=UPI0023013B9D|nr:uncharacterized protein BDF20DRAFT_814285 [Mycotypha africana]KAI8987722.1 hypothetical protein BDF20DRAFT_814285 [Mycotypha africana]
MVSTFAAIITCLILIPTIPLVLYAIGRLLPESHIVSRSFKYNTTAGILWTILTSIEDYPAWRSNISKIVVRQDDYENDINKYEDERRVTFTEYTRKNKRTTVINIEQEPGRKLLRVVEERPYIMPGETESTSKANTTFSGSWTFVLKPVEEEERAVVLKITEQGVIKQPMVRTFNMLFGNYRRIERFLKDLNKEVALGILDEALRKEEAEEAEMAKNSEEIQRQELSASIAESKLLDKEWDMMNEVCDEESHNGNFE